MTSSRCINLHVIFLILIVVDCGNLTAPANGQVTLTETTFGRTANYSCNTGYNLVGNSTRTCQETGEWSGSVPTCEGMLLNGGHFTCIFKSTGLFLTLEGCMLEHYVSHLILLGLRMCRVSLVHGRHII